MRKVSLFIGLALFALAGSARAQNEAAPPVIPDTAPPALDANGNPVAAPEAAPAPAPVAAAPAGDDYVSRGLTVGAGTLQVTVPIVLNLSKEAVLKPVWVPLDLRYGVTPELEVFLSHAGQNFPIATSGGVCLGGKERGCGKLYDNLNLGAQFSLSKSGGIELTGIGALEFRSLDPMYLAIDLGVGFKFVSGQLAIKAAPQISIGATKRSEGNKEHIYVPVQAAFQATPELALFLDTGIYSPVTDMGKMFTVPLGIGAAFAVQPGLDVGAQFLLPMVVMGSFYKDAGMGAADMRMLGLFATYRTN